MSSAQTEANGIPAKNSACSIFFEYQNVVIPDLYKAPSGRAAAGSPPKPDWALRLKTLKSEHPGTALFDMVDPDVIKCLKSNYHSTLLGMIDVTHESIKEKVEAFNNLCLEDESLGAASCQHAGQMLKEDLSNCKKEADEVKLLAKIQTKTAGAIASYANWIFLYGIREIGRRGLLNSLELCPCTIAAIRTSGVIPSSLWKEKVREDDGKAMIMDDIMSLFERLNSQNQGSIKADEPLVLMLAPKSLELAQICMDEIKEAFPALTIIEIPELAKAKSGDPNLIMLLPQRANGDTLFVSDTPSFNVSAFLETDEPDDIPKYVWEITGCSPSLCMINPALIARMCNI